MDDLENEIEALIKAKKNKQTFKPVAAVDIPVTPTKPIVSVKPIIADKPVVSSIKPKADLLQKPDLDLAKTNEKILPKAVVSPLKQDDIITRQSIIAQLRLAKMGHKKWISNVHILTTIGDIYEAKSAIPVNFTMCDFGKWYYGEGQVLSAFDEYNNLEQPHQMIHDSYLKIFTLYKVKIEGSLFNSEKKQLKQRAIESKKLESILSDYSELLFANLFALEAKVKTLSDEDLVELNLY